MITYPLKKGDLLRNKATGDIAILWADPYTRFYPDEYHRVGDIESGVVTTCYPLTFTVIQGDNTAAVGAKISIRKSNLKRNWERLCK